jgi:hypothetical protein
MANYSAIQVQNEQNLIEICQKMGSAKYVRISVKRM